MRFSTILFDLDGTLLDSIELIMESYRHTMRCFRGECPPDDLFLEGLGTPHPVSPLARGTSKGSPG